jgi:hypothetical protein
MKQYLYLAAETARLRDPELAATYAAAIARQAPQQRGRNRRCSQARTVRLCAAQETRGGWSPASTYRLRRPGDRAELSAPEAIEYIQANYPSKAERARREKAARNLPRTGSPKGATKGSTSAPPATPVLAVEGCGKPQGEIVIGH